MFNKFIDWAESLTIEQIELCILVMLIAAFSLGFCIGKGTEYSLQTTIQTEVIGNEKN